MVCIPAIVLGGCAGSSGDSSSQTTQANAMMDSSTVASSYTKDKLSLIANDTTNKKEAFLIATAKEASLQVWRDETLVLTQVRDRDDSKDNTLFYEEGMLRWIYNNLDESFISVDEISAGLNLSYYDANRKKIAQYALYKNGKSYFVARLVNGSIKSQRIVSDAITKLIETTYDSLRTTRRFRTGYSLLAIAKSMEIDGASNNTLLGFTEKITEAGVATMAVTSLQDLESKESKSALELNAQISEKINSACSEESDDSSCTPNSEKSRNDVAFLTLGNSYTDTMDMIENYLSDSVKVASDYKDIALFDTPPEGLPSDGLQTDVLDAMKKAVASNSTSSNSTTPLILTMSEMVKKTGQKESFALYDDGYYQKGITPSYTRDDYKETVLDMVTGLMWQDDAAVKITTKPWLEAENYDVGTYTNTSGDTAISYCSTLTLGGYSDWRLPAVEELLGITVEGSLNPVLDTSVFVNYHTDCDYWTSSVLASSNYHVWVVNFRHGYTNVYSKKSSNALVRCVRKGV